MFREPRRATAAVFAIALLSRLAWVVWAFDAIPPHDDGTFYHLLAQRLAEGHGYTWLWPDGTVTPTAHYPVGYPAALSVLYRLWGPQPGLGMVLAAVLGACAAGLLHRALVGWCSSRAAWWAALAFALHPALLSYTPAIMTEGVTASLYAIALYAMAMLAKASTLRARGAWVLALGAVLASASYVRPQSVVLAVALPLALLALRPATVPGRRAPTEPAANRLAWRRALTATPLVVLATLVWIAPWTARNCEQMGTCGFVSFNGGWNLLIATDRGAHGTWAELKVPPECTDVFDEAKKDACFGQAARRAILAEPLGFLSLAPQKLAATFDYFGAGPYYLHAANPEAFPHAAKTALGALELIYQRLLVVLATAGLWLQGRPERGRRATWWAVTGGVILSISGFVGVLALALLAVARARKLSGLALPLLAGASVLLSTAAIHTVFFGAGRYGLVIIPGCCVLFGCGAGPWLATRQPTAK